MTTEQFEALPKNEQKILIAKDVIQRMDSALYEVSVGNYLQPEHSLYSLPKSSDAKTAIVSGLANCTVCARGAMFLSMVVFKNRLNVDEVINYGFGYHTEVEDYCEATDYLSTAFSQAEQAQIENAFEQTYSYGIRLNSEESRLAAMCFGSEFNEDNDRLHAIMQNIIDNNGEFKP